MKRIPPPQAISLARFPACRFGKGRVCAPESIGRRRVHPSGASSLGKCLRPLRAKGSRAHPMRSPPRSADPIRQHAARAADRRASGTSLVAAFRWRLRSLRQCSRGKRCFNGAALSSRHSKGAAPADDGARMSADINADDRRAFFASIRPLLMDTGLCLLVILSITASRFFNSTFTYHRVAFPLGGRSRADPAWLNNQTAIHSIPA